MWAANNPGGYLTVPSPSPPFPACPTREKGVQVLNESVLCSDLGLLTGVTASRHPRDSSHPRVADALP